MALTEAQQRRMDEVLEAMPEGKARDQWKALAEENPEAFLDPYLRTQDYTKKMQAAAEKEKLAIEQHKANTDWYSKNVGDFAKAVEAASERDRLQRELEEARAQLEAGGGRDTDEGDEFGDAAAKALQGEVQKLNKKIDALSASAKDVVTTEVAEQYRQRIVADIAEDLFTLDDIQARHFRDFGEHLPMKSLRDFAQEHKVPDFPTAYERMVSERRTNERIQKGIEEGLKQEREKLQAEHSAQTLPGAGSGAGMGHFQRKLQPVPEKAADEPPAGLTPEQRIEWMGRAAGEALAREQKTA